MAIGGKKIRGISRDTIEFILAASQSSLPFKFAGVLRAEKDIINEVVIYPGTEGQTTSAIIRLTAKFDIHEVGSVHSHVEPDCKPHKEDIIFFRKNGHYHIITCAPFNEDNWACYDNFGQRRALPVLENGLDNEDVLTTSKPSD